LIDGFTTPPPVVSVKIKPKVRPAPVATIVKMTNRGLINIEWSMDMRVPTKNKLKSIPTDVEKWFDKRGFPQDKPVMEIIINRGEFSPL
jgi:hypothetical protein